MIDTAKERVYSLSEFARELKKQRHLDRDSVTIAGWARIGCTPRGTNRSIKLETIDIVNVAHTSFEAFDRFIREQHEAKLAAEMAS